WAPRVVATFPAAGEVLTDSPTELTVQFDAPLNLAQLVSTEFERDQTSGVPAVFIRSAGGKVYYPRLVSLDTVTHRATFLMVDALPDGAYELHLSGAHGLTDLGGTPLGGNDPSGDYLVRFQVQGSGRTEADPSPIRHSSGAQDPDHPQDLGTLFPTELAD